MQLKDLRLEKSLTQEEVAKAIKTSQRNIGRWENGENEPTASFIARLANYFDVSADYLLGLEDDFGARTAASTSEGGATEQERELLRLFRELSPYLKGMTLNAVRSWAKNDGDSERKKV